MVMNAQPDLKRQNTTAGKTNENMVLIIQIMKIRSAIVMADRINCFKSIYRRKYYLHRLSFMCLMHYQAGECY